MARIFWPRAFAVIAFALYFCANVFFYRHNLGERPESMNPSRGGLAKRHLYILRHEGGGVGADPTHTSGRSPLSNINLQ